MSRGSRAGFNGCTLFVGGLSPNTRASDVGHEFERFGPLKRCDIPMSNGRSRGHGFVEFKYPQDADAAYRNMARCELDGRLITVEWAKAGPGRGWNEPRRDDRRDDRREIRRDDYRRDDRREDYRRDDRRDFRRDEPRRDRDELRRDEPRRDDPRRDEPRRERDEPRRDIERDIERDEPRRHENRDDHREDSRAKVDDRKRVADDVEEDRGSKRQRTDHSDDVEEVHEYAEEHRHPSVEEESA
eukprot:TRINITY_DN244_c0_g2_i1.p1 TRINITY_DN244_c0_g2~~TRINITY_DN244_c0_g2_i1.p1  ORF type:complete len:243 (-),score=55.49 TRINITY_DN244_c0_g2_i1:35-763(-)